VIGIAGPSGSGKTALARRLAARLPAPVLSLDDYYRDLSYLALGERERQNFDDPAMIDWPLLRENLRAFRQGREMAKPVYDFTTHTRSAKVERLPPGPMLIVEGLFALYDEEVRALSSTRVFVSLDDAVCFARRLARDMRERGRSRESVLRQYNETVRPMAERYVLPTRAFADVVVSGDARLEESAAAVIAHARGQHPP